MNILPEFFTILFASALCLCSMEMPAQVEDIDLDVNKLKSKKTNEWRLTVNAGFQDYLFIIDGISYSIAAHRLLDNRWILGIESQYRKLSKLDSSYLNYHPVYKFVNRENNFIIEAQVGYNFLRKSTRSSLILNTGFCAIYDAYDYYSYFRFSPYQADVIHKSQINGWYVGVPVRLEYSFRFLPRWSIGVFLEQKFLLTKMPTYTVRVFSYGTTATHASGPSNSLYSNRLSLHFFIR